MSLTAIKTLVALIVLAAGLLGASLPWVLQRSLPSERTLALADTFAGGVLGGAGLLHLLSAGNSGFRRFAPNIDYPLAPLLAGVGFLLILLIEGVIVGKQSAVGNAQVRHGHAVSHELGYGPPSVQPTKYYPYVLLIVLSVHSVIVGLALGAQQSVYGVFIVFAAILAHKSVAGFALGIGYAKTRIPWRSAMPKIAFFAASTPVAILAATVIGVLTSLPGGHLFTAIFDSLGAGTFLYIAALDIIRSEFNNPDDGLSKWLSTCAGFAVMAILALWI